MKRLLLIALLLAGCGQNCENPDLTNNAIVWRGTADQYSSDMLTKGIQETIDCLRSINPAIVQRSGSPLMVITENMFQFQNDTHDGCYNGCNTVYIWEDNLISFQISLSDFTNYIEVASPTFRHEIIHWATSLKNSEHKSIYFTKCEN